MAGARVRLVFGSCSDVVRFLFGYRSALEIFVPAPFDCGRDCVMEDRLQEILNDLPAVTSRSCLEPYRELIREMRQRNYSYRKISQVLAEKCALRISHSIVHDFVQRHLHDSPSTQVRGSGVESPAQRAFAMAKPTGADRARPVPARDERIGERIAGIKRRSPIPQADSPAFQFDASEPLRLKPGKT